MTYGDDYMCPLMHIVLENQSSAAVTGILGGNSGKDDTKEDGSSSSESSDQKLAEQETIFLTGVLDELKIVVSNSLDVS
jgi:vacuolar protein sorting-associated protein 13A/C